MRCAFFLLVAFVALPSWAQEKKDPGQARPDAFQRKVDEAIKRGLAYLKKEHARVPTDPEKGLPTCELVLWTFVHAGVTETDPDSQKLFRDMIGRDLAHTYNVALQAMILEELHRVRYQGRIWECGQFLVDNQCKNGQWSYGEGTLIGKIPPGRRKRASVETGGARKKPSSISPGHRRKPDVVLEVPVTRRREGPATGDNSNSQYAALGLRACHDAGVIMPAEVLQRAQKQWRDSPSPAGNGEKSPYPVVGWHYSDGAGTGPAYGSMTAGAVGSLVIYDYMLKEPWTRDKVVAAGMNWLAHHFTVSQNPKMAEAFPGRIEFGPRTSLYYYLYALERAGVLYGTESFGRHEWYAEGARFILADQQADGSWSCKEPLEYPLLDTCFAILFLRRATAPLTPVASVDNKSHDK
jgi:hypothetical protein